MLRQCKNVPAVAAGFDHASSNIDLNVVRLCFQVFLPDASGQVTRVVPPVSSHPIHDKSKILCIRNLYVHSCLCVWNYIFYFTKNKMNSSDVINHCLELTWLFKNDTVEIEDMQLGLTYVFVLCAEALNDLVICRVDKSSGRARGGDEVFLLCEKVGKGEHFAYS